MKAIANLFGILVLAGVAWFCVWHFFGTTKVVANFEGSLIDGANVYLDGKEVGKTPYLTRLTPGMHRIKVLPPDGYDADLVSETLYFFTMGKGTNYEVHFHLPATDGGN